MTTGSSNTYIYIHMNSVGILGAGSWGTALAEIVAQAGNKVYLWDRNAQLLQSIAGRRENTKYHPGITLSESIYPESKLETVIQKAQILILAIPSHLIRRYLNQIHKDLSKTACLVCAAKGIEADSLKTISLVVQDVFGKERAEEMYCILSGPSFAQEVVRKIPTAVTIACVCQATAQKVQESCNTPTFKIFTSTDVIGVELAGALKNVIAIAAGAIDGFGFGLNARAALITRGLNEIAQIGMQNGANPLTFSGLSGMGDLILTCTGDLSRNRQVGLKLTQGKSLKQVIKEVGQVAEGIRTAKAAYQLAKKFGIDAPILEEVYQTLYENKDPQQAIKSLLERAPEEEFRGFLLR